MLLPRLPRSAAFEFPPENISSPETYSKWGWGMRANVVIINHPLQSYHLPFTIGNQTSDRLSMAWWDRSFSDRARVRWQRIIAKFQIRNWERRQLKMTNNFHVCISSSPHFTWLINCSIHRTFAFPCFCFEITHSNHRLTAKTPMHERWKTSGFPCYPTHLSEQETCP